ncbi:hypothetical protein GCM10009117_05540 [Gangjinia marincola]|uniref:Uncharacterized protein n=1 Tax=Gangjinia marincola TaxID=578463 RepID=A0ABN1MEE9_9FLAO
MKPYTFLLRDKPKLAFNIGSNEFEVIDLADQKNSGQYLFSHLKNVVYKKESTVYLVSALSYIFDFLSGTGASGTFKDKARLEIALKNKTLHIWLIDADKSKAQTLCQMLNNRKQM